MFSFLTYSNQSSNSTKTTKIYTSKHPGADWDQKSALAFQTHQPISFFDAHTPAHFFSSMSPKWTSNLAFGHCARCLVCQCKHPTPPQQSLYIIIMPWPMREHIYLKHLRFNTSSYSLESRWNSLICICQQNWHFSSCLLRSSSLFCL